MCNTILEMCLDARRQSDSNFSQDWIIIFSDILHDDSWPWYLVIDETKFKKKKKWWPEFGLKWGFSTFSWVWIVHFAWNNIQLRQCITTSRGKIHEEKLWGGAKLGQAGQNRTQYQVFCNFFKFCSLVFLQTA